MLRVLSAANSHTHNPRREEETFSHSPRNKRAWESIPTRPEDVKHCCLRVNFPGVLTPAAPRYTTGTKAADEGAAAVNYLPAVKGASVVGVSVVGPGIVGPGRGQITKSTRKQAYKKAVGAENREARKSAAEDPRTNWRYTEKTSTSLNSCRWTFTDAG